jgi:hypothetical protein
MKRFAASFGFALILTALALGQSSSGWFSTGANGANGSMRFGPPPPISGSFFSSTATIAGAPFSVEVVDEMAQTLEDGTHIERTDSRRKIYRDSMGRTRSEHQAFRGALRRPDMPEGPTIVEIVDPIAHVRYIFDLDEPVAHRQKLPAEFRGDSTPGHPTRAMTGNPADTGTAQKPDAGNGSTATIRELPTPAMRLRGDGEGHLKITTEDLGTQVIEGIPAEGKRRITTWPVGFIGNDRPITNVSESWTSPDLREVILRKTNDPRSGEHTHKLVNINRGEPDPSLFEPPPNYTVKDEGREFTLDWRTR